MAEELAVRAAVAPLELEGEFLLIMLQQFPSAMCLLAIILQLEAMEPQR